MSNSAMVITITIFPSMFSISINGRIAMLNNVAHCVARSFCNLSGEEIPDIEYGSSPSWFSETPTNMMPPSRSGSFEKAQIVSNTLLSSLLVHCFASILRCSSIELSSAKYLFALFIKRRAVKNNKVNGLLLTR